MRIYSKDVTRCHKRQVHTVDQTVHHQGIQSVFVGGRLWTLLPPPALQSEKSTIALSLESGCTHTHRCKHTALIANSQQLSYKKPESSADTAGE